MKQKVLQTIKAAMLASGITPPENIEIMMPKDESFGDFTTPVAMVLAKSMRSAPRKIAETIVQNMSLDDSIEKVTVEGAGFINFTLRKAYLHDAVRQIMETGPAFFRVKTGNGRKVQIEFVSANPTGPLHLGHGRGAAVGSALANIMREAGYLVECEYYVNDAGRQVKLLGESVLARYKELLGIEYPFPEDGYRGDYVIDIAQKIKTEFGDRYAQSSFKDDGRHFTDHALNLMLDQIKHDLASFGVEFDYWQSERALYDNGAVAHAIEFLKDKGLMYHNEGALWFRATEFGDEKDRVVIKADGEHTYFASDIAYHLKKVESGLDEIIDIWGADHHGYIPRLEAVIDALGYEREKLKVLLIQMVNLLRGGVQVQMSKRSGEFVTLREIVDEVGADITRFIFLTRRHDSQLSFDLEAAKAASSENPVFYIQYANARINSIFLKAAEGGIERESISGADLSVLTNDEEISLIRKLLEYRTVFESAAETREPHRITFYLQELAAQFHQYYNRHRIVADDAQLSKARLCLVEAVRIAIRDGLSLLGVTAPEKM